MKTSIKPFNPGLFLAFVLLSAMLLSACGGFWDSEFAGTYVNSAGSEFSLADDTLIVEKAEQNHFLIHRRTGFRLLDESGKPGKRQFEKEEWIAVYNPQTGIMTEQTKGKVIGFSSDKMEMRVAKRGYKRIN
ncbi:MAG: hypothetical protein EOO45_01090 [Flavobacterium sp.]|nr:MAG: hypothetical protein EOO45_01090 [Flavobacterium sp.]